MSAVESNDNNGITKQKPPRTAKACDFCKQKKLKCDGQNPCIRCQKNMMNCVYTHVERPKRITRKRSSKKAAINNLDTRIGKLEELLSTLVSKIDDKSGNGKVFKPHGSVVNNELNSLNDSKDITKSASSSDGTNSETSDEDSSTTLAHTPSSAAENESIRTKNNPRASHAELNISQENPSCEYVGSQCTLSIFSAQGLVWLSKRAKDPNIIKPVLNMVKEMVIMLGTQRETLSHPISANEVVPLPSRDQCLELLEVYEKPTMFAVYILDKEDMKGLVDRYFGIVNHEIHDGPTKQLSSAEMLSLYLMIVFGACYKAEEGVREGNDEAIIRYQKLEHRYLISSLYYYQRISIFGQGIPGLQAILLLICYIDLSILPEFDYILISTAVRFAQALGLHRKESLSGLPEEEVTVRKRLWFLCYMLDRDLCLKSGKPPMINDEDMSSIETDGLLVFLQSVKEKSSMKLGIPTSEVNLENLDHCNTIYFILQSSPTIKSLTILEYTWLELAKITSKAYNQLFSANAFHGKTRSDVLQIIGSLNNNLENLRTSLPISIRPGHPILIPNSSNTYDDDFHKVIRTHVAYHLIVMVINRMALRKHWDYDHGTSSSDETDHNNHNLGVDVENHFKNFGSTHKEYSLERNFSKLCLDSCQEIMKICNVIIKSNFNLWIAGSFVLFSSYVISLTYIIENPQEIEAKTMLKDIFSMFLDTHFQFYPMNRTDLINCIKINGLGFSISIFLKIATKIYNENNPKEMLSDDLLKKLDDAILDSSQRLTYCMEYYRTQQPLVEYDKTGIALSNIPVRDIIINHFKFGGVQITKNSKSSTIELNRFNSDVNNAEKSTLIDITRESFNPDQHDFNTGFTSQLPKLHSLPQFVPSHSTIMSNLQQHSLNQSPPSVDEVLDTTDLQMNWNNFSHGLFNIPVPFMDDLAETNSNGVNNFSSQFL